MKKKLAILIILFSLTACEYIRLNRSNSSSEMIDNSSFYSSSNKISSNDSSSLIITSSSTISEKVSTSSKIDISTSSSQYYSSSSSSISKTLPDEAQEFVNAVNSIVVDYDAGDDIAYAFDLFDKLLDWDYPEVLDAFDKLCLYETQYYSLINNNSYEIYIEMVADLPEEITLDDEYLIIRVEETYKKLNDVFKELPEVMEAYAIMVNKRNQFNEIANEAIEKKDEEDIEAFLLFANSIPNSSEITYSDFFNLQECLKMHSLLSEKAKESVEETYNRLLELTQVLNVKDGTGLFNINIIHKGNNYESIFDIQGISEEHKVTGTKKVFEFQIYEDDVKVEKAKILKWGDAPYSYSYTKDNGIHSFAFTLGGYYDENANYRLNFIIETDLGEAYAISILYLVDGIFTCFGYNEADFYNNMLNQKVSTLPKDDYSKENWDKIQSLLQEGLEALENSVNTEHSKMICNQYYTGILSVETRFTNVDGLKIAGYSSGGNINNIIDKNTGSRWQADTIKTEYIIIDLGEVKEIAGLDIMWEAANAKEYSVKLSNENTNWENINASISFTGGLSGSRTDKLRLDENIECRYIRLDFTVATMQYGYSIYELYVLQEK